MTHKNIDQAIRISDFENVYKIDYANDVTAIVTGNGNIGATTMRVVVKDLGFIFSGQNIGGGSGLFISKELQDNNDYYLKLKTLQPYHPVAIEEHDDHLVFTLAGGVIETGISSGDGAHVFNYSNNRELYFNTLTGTGGIVATSTEDYIVLDTAPEEFEVINGSLTEGSPYDLNFETNKTYVVDPSVTELHLGLQGGIKSSINHKNGSCAFIAVPETCTWHGLGVYTDSTYIGEKMTPTMMRKGCWNYIHLYYTSGANSRYRTSNDSLINDNDFGWSWSRTRSFNDLPALSLYQDPSLNNANDDDLYHKILTPNDGAGEPLTNHPSSFLNFSQQVEPLIFYSIYQ